MGGKATTLISIRIKASTSSSKMCILKKSIHRLQKGFCKKVYIDFKRFFCFFSLDLLIWDRKWETACTFWFILQMPGGLKTEVGKSSKAFPLNLIYLLERNWKSKLKPGIPIRNGAIFTNILTTRLNPNVCVYAFFNSKLQINYSLEIWTWIYHMPV